MQNEKPFGTNQIWAHISGAINVLLHYQRRLHCAFSTFFSSFTCFRFFTPFIHPTLIPQFDALFTTFSLLLLLPRRRCSRRFCKCSGDISFFLLCCCCFCSDTHICTHAHCCFCMRVCAFFCNFGWHLATPATRLKNVLSYFDNVNYGNEQIR